MKREKERTKGRDIKISTYAANTQLSSATPTHNSVYNKVQLFLYISILLSSCDQLLCLLNCCIFSLSLLDSHSVVLRLSRLLYALSYAVPTRVEFVCEHTSTSTCNQMFELPVLTEQVNGLGKFQQTKLEALDSLQIVKLMNLN